MRTSRFVATTMGSSPKPAAANVYVVDDGTVSKPSEHQILVGTTRTELLDLLEAHDK